MSDDDPADDERLADGDVATSADVDVASALGGLREATPLVESLTNSVTISEVANVVLHWGGLPVMTQDDEDAVEMTAGAAGVLLNMGTADGEECERMVATGEAAADAGVPVVFDPVGVGATPRRDAFAEEIVDAADLAVVKGNYGEVTALAGADATVQGVESVGEYAEIAETAIACARRTGAVVVASGEVDVVADEHAAYEVDVGDPMMGRFVGTGCMLGGSLAAFVGANATPDAEDATSNALEAVLAGTTAFGIAGELAAESGDWNGPASYRTAFMDAIAGLDADDLADASDRIDPVVEA